MNTRTPTTFKLEGEVTSLSESSQGEVGKLLGEVNLRLIETLFRDLSDYKDV